jgi:hypothetical protein
LSLLAVMDSDWPIIVLYLDLFGCVRLRGIEVTKLCLLFKP